jgi:C-terminal processing protease CtpA/Prc
LATLLTGCGGGGGSGGGTASPAPSPAPTVSPSPTPSPSTAQCSLRARHDWALARLNEWYLFPNLLDTTVNPAAHPTVQSYIDALVAPARAQNRDRYFTYLTSIAEENAYYEQGATAGFGIRLGFVGSRLFVTEAFEGGPALASGLDRGTEILGIGTSNTNVQSVSSLLASGGVDALVNALGPDTAGVTRVLHVRDQSGVERQVTVAKTEFALDPVSDRYGVKVITDGARRVGYLNLRTFIGTAVPDLRAAFASFKAQGVTELIIDLRYNGGGLISVAELMGDLMAEGRNGQVFEYVAFRPSKSNENETYTFNVQPESIAPTKVAFIGTGSTASASELVINGFVPYLGNNIALVGSNTYGKPVGQIALDNPACDDRLRAVALQIQNADRQGEYYNGLATTVPVTCAAYDDVSLPLGDPGEAMTRRALDFLAGRSCTPISARAGASAAPAGTQVGTPARREALLPQQPRSTFERETPGAF